MPVDIQEPSHLLPILRNIFDVLALLVDNKYDSFLISKGIETKDLKDTPYWKKKIGNEYAFKVAIREEIGSDENVNINYFLSSKIEERFDGKNKKDFQTDPISIYLKFLGYKNPNVFEQFDRFLTFIQEKRLVSKEDVEKQREAICVQLGKTLLKKEINKMNDSQKKAFVDRFDGSVWWFYFLGYPLEKEDRDANLNWRLIKLIATLTGRKGRLEVYIKNTKKTGASQMHYDYTGQIELDVSTDKVMVMNLRTVEQISRQLNVKISIPSLDGTFFLGQYLNYDGSGRVFSGTVIIEQILTVKPNASVLEAYTYHFPEDYSNPNKLNDVAHIIDFFKEKNLNYRKTTNRVSDIKSYNEWQMSRNKNED